MVASDLTTEEPVGRSQAKLSVPSGSAGSSKPAYVKRRAFTGRPGTWRVKCHHRWRCNGRHRLRGSTLGGTAAPTRSRELRQQASGCDAALEELPSASSHAELVFAGTRDVLNFAADKVDQTAEALRMIVELLDHVAESPLGAVLRRRGWRALNRPGVRETARPHHRHRLPRRPGHRSPPTRHRPDHRPSGLRRDRENPHLVLQLQDARPPRRGRTAVTATN